MKPPLPHLPPSDHLARERVPLIAPHGFRDYDARWRYPDEINLLGVQCLGRSLGALLRELATERGDTSPGPIVVGRDFRAYSLAVHQALCLGLLDAGMEILDIGLCLSPMAYFARDALNAPAVAMVTASHNENGWTGFKMGATPPFTFGDAEMNRLRNLALSGAAAPHPGGIRRHIPDLPRLYAADLAARPGFTSPLRIVTACGNGTAGAFAPGILRRLGARVIALDCDPHYAFPRHEPNPEHAAMLAALRDKTLETGADFGLAFDGDGDRIGVADGRGRILFADKVGLLLARDLAARHADAHFLVDSKSTGLFRRDAVLRQAGGRAEYWRTGHSHLKTRMAETGALAAFEKSGHWYFAPPLGHGYDDALLGAVLLCEMLCRSELPLADLHDGLEASFVSPTIGAECSDARKHDIAAALRDEYAAEMRRGGLVAGREIVEIAATDGVRFTLSDGSWGLVRASSNKPSLVLVVESLTSREDMVAIFADLEARVRRFPEVGAYDQSLDALGKDETIAKQGLI